MHRRDELRRWARVCLASAVLAGCSGGERTADEVTPPPGTPSVSISGGSVAEGDAGTGTLEFGVQLSAPSDNTVSVSFATVDVSASSGSDFDAANGTLTFTAGETSQTITIDIVGDTMFERDERFEVDLSDPENATLSTSTAEGTITNDDAVPLMSIADASATEGDSGTSTLDFQVTLSAPSGISATADFSTADATATAGDDYLAASGSVSFPAGTTLQTISVTVNGDNGSEPDEELTLTLSNPGDAAFGDSSATGTIADDDATGSQPGLDTRPLNSTCVAPPRQTGGAGITVPDAFPLLPAINLPTKIIMEPVTDPRWFVLQKTGELRTFDPGNATTMPVYLDLSSVVRTSSEGGLLGLAFHPNYPATPEIFLSYTRDHTGPAMRSVVSRFILDDVVSPGPGTVEQVIIEIDQDFDNHNGGDIDFGADGYLYIGLGDGGSGGDPNNRAQDPRHMLGSFLRLDVLGPGVSFPANPYNIPPDNPFAGNPECSPGLNTDDCPEIYATGLRNPWRWSFDPATGQLWAGDVGQGNREEVDLIELGGNYGWRCFEGSANLFLPGCPSTGFVDPVSEYPHTSGNISITGGYVYRGTAISALAGRYVFADYGSGRIWALLPDGQGGYTNDELIDTSHGITSFGVDQFGELYYTNINTGRIHKIEPGSGGSGDNIPTLLSDSGCVDSGDITLPYSGLVPYEINALFWSDNAVKDRWIGIPDGTTISIGADDDWDFPAGTVIVKNFRLNGRLIETRHLMRHPDGVWAGYTYEWNASETEATRVQGGKTVLIDGQDWIFPSEGDCMSCHTSAAGFSLGAETAQLNRDFTYPSTQRTANQLETLDHISMFSAPLPGPVQTLPALTDPADTAASLADRARAYLHTNCAQCHRPGGPTPSSMDFRYDTPLANTDACDATPQEGDLGITDARIIAPGDSARSVLIARIGLRDSNGMPPLGSSIVDAAGVSLLSSWIDGLSNCD